MTPIDVYSCTRSWAEDNRLKVWAQETTASTNLIAKDDADPFTCPTLEASPLSAPSLYLARKQTAGRGRGANVWISPEAGGFFSSWSFAVAASPQPILAPLAGLALFEAASETWPLVAFNLKAPNDLYIEDRKVAGILIETVETWGTVTDRRVVVGLGMNILTPPTSLASATSLAEHLREPLRSNSWRAFLSTWSSKLTGALRSGQQEYLQPEARERLRAALNLHPHLESPILKSDEIGQMHFAHSIVRWQDL